MNYLKGLFGMPELTVHNIIYISIIILLFIVALFLMLKDIFSKTMSNRGILSFRIGGVIAMLIMIPTIGKEAPIDTWLFGALLGAFIGATLFSVTSKKKDAIFIIIYGVIGIIIGIVCEKFMLL